MRKSIRGLFFATILALALLLLFFGAVQATLPLWPLLVPGNPVLNPANNTHTAPTTTTVSITYDETISPTTVSTRTFAVQAMQTGLLTQTYSVNNGTISLSPAQPFKPGELVQASATTGTLNLSGQGPISATVWQFWTEVGDSSGTFRDSGQRPGGVDISSTGVALGDVDGDGDLDAFLANTGWNSGDYNHVWLNDGTGNFSDSGQRLGDSESMAVALGDVDGDGDLDAFVANELSYGISAANKVWLNNGTGTFSDSGQSLGWQDSSTVALGDVDGDGDLDAFIGNYSFPGPYPNRVWLNDGKGNFIDSGQGLGDSGSMAVALGDVDGDGDLDAFVANGFSTNAFKRINKVWLNNGKGNFVDSGQSLGSRDSRGVALGDLDGDGDLDAFVVNIAEANKVWLNDGTGTFNDSGQSLGNFSSCAVALGDVDGDGDLDAFVGNSNYTDKVWLNDGTGTFDDSGQSLSNSGGSTIVMGDVDGDGDLDVFISNYNSVWLNRNKVGLGITKSVMPTGTLDRNDAITYTLTYSNAGPQIASGVVITDLVPITVTNVSFASSGALVTPTGSTSYTWQVQDLLPEAGGVITIYGRIGPMATDLFVLTNQAVITTTEFDTDTTNNVAVVHSNVKVEPSFVYLPFVAKNYDSSLPYFDDFSDPDSGWYVGDSIGDVSFSYQDGEYEILLRNADWWWDGMLAPLGCVTDYSVEADMRRYSGSSTGHGLVFGLQDWDHFYLFFIESGQYYSVWRKVPDDPYWVPLVDWTFSAYINPSDATNHLKVERNGSQIAVYVNDQFLVAVDDSVYSGCLQVGLYASTNPELPDVPATVRYDNFQVKQLETVVVLNKISPLQAQHPQEPEAGQPTQNSP